MKQPSELFLCVNKVSKYFAANKVLSEVSLTVCPGEYHALIGENGAGKSTLINLITGLYQHDEGTICIDGVTYDKMTPLLAQKLGICTVHQELSINPFLSVSQNIFLGNEILKGGFMDTRTMNRITSELLQEVGLSHIRPDEDAGSLTMAEQQMVEFCKAIHQKPRLLILDEATSALDNGQVEVIFSKLRSLKDSGLMIIFISHRLHELYDICDIMTVLKDGKHIVTEPIEDFEQDRLVSLMTGRTIVDLFPPKRSRAEMELHPIVVEADRISFGKSKDMSFYVRRGEILGIGGLQGQGQQEILECLFGLKKVKSGTLKLDDKPVKMRGAKDAMNLGIAYLPAERKTQGLLITHTIRFNLSFASLDRLSNKIGAINSRLEHEAEKKAIRDFSIRIANINQLVSELSGGNQQKVVLAKWLSRNPRLLLLNEPTRGIDVGTKKEIYELLYRLAEEGVSILMISSDTLELIGMCDRVLTVYENNMNGELYTDELCEESLVKASVFRKEKQ
ncbi:sugar ABC transporter ATP-binding protein [Oscillospiraceae bacterium PP1C4]